MRFFFDYTTRDRSLYDYRGEDFGTVESAIQYAGEIAENLKHSLAGDWAGWCVEVRNDEGKKLSSLHIATAGAD